MWENAVCLSITMRRPGITRRLSDDQYEVDADKSTTRASKQILDCHEYDKVKKIDTAFKTWLNAVALPCSYIRGGMFPVALASVEMIDEKLESYKVDRQVAIDEFMAVYRTRIEDQKTELRSLFNEADYPSDDAMRDAFAVSSSYVSFDTPSNLKTLKDGFFAKEKQKTEKRLNDAADAIEHAMAVGLQKLVDHLADKLSPSTDGSKKIIRDGAVNNVLDFLETFSTRNITNDDELSVVVEQAKSVLEGVDGKQLRKNAEVRHDITNKLKAIGETLGGMVTTRKRRVILD